MLSPRARGSNAQALMNTAELSRILDEERLSDNAGPIGTKGTRSANLSLDFDLLRLVLDDRCLE